MTGYVHMCMYSLCIYIYIYSSLSYIMNIIIQLLQNGDSTQALVAAILPRKLEVLTAATPEPRDSFGRKSTDFSSIDSARASSKGYKILILIILVVILFILIIFILILSMSTKLPNQCDKLGCWSALHDVFVASLPNINAIAHVLREASGVSVKYCVCPRLLDSHYSMSLQQKTVRRL